MELIAASFTIILVSFFFYFSLSSLGRRLYASEGLPPQYEEVSQKLRAMSLP